jgi:hypothetical protein
VPGNGDKRGHERKEEIGMRHGIWDKEGMGGWKGDGDDREEGPLGGSEEEKKKAKEKRRV